MFEKQTVIVVGAGASCEYGLPLGGELLGQISSSIDFTNDRIGKSKADEQLANYIRTNYQEKPRALEDIGRICERMRKVFEGYQSIDEGLHYLRGEPYAVEIGKLAIARAISSAERKAELFGLGKNFEGRVYHWLALFHAMAVAGASKQDAERLFENVKIVCFNYDRVIEHGLFHQLQRISDLDAKRAAAVVNRLVILRPYGRLGRLSWQPDTQSGGIIPFGGFDRPGENDYGSMASSLRTFTEAQKTDAEIQDALSEARLVLLLGFGFGSQNLEILQSSRGTRPKRKVVLGTMKGLDAENRSYLQGRIQNDMCRGAEDCEVRLFDWTCAQLLHNMRTTISALVTSR
jgi:hypothetical protein